MAASKKELPFDIESPDEERAEGAGDRGGEGGRIPGYVEPWKRCATCEYFDADNARCKKFSAPADMDGSCPSWEENEGAEDNAAEDRAEREAEDEGDE